MGDRCSVNLTCREQDVQRFALLGFDRGEWQGEDDTAIGVEMSGHKMKNAATSELEALAHVGIPFYGSHGAGAAYGEMLFASAHGESVWVAHMDDCPSVPVERDGTIQPHYLNRVSTYYHLQAAAETLIAASMEDGINE